MRYAYPIINKDGTGVVIPVVDGEDWRWGRDPEASHKIHLYRVGIFQFARTELKQYARAPYTRDDFLAALQYARELVGRHVDNPDLTDEEYNILIWSLEGRVPKDMYKIHKLPTILYFGESNMNNEQYRRLILESLQEVLEEAYPYAFDSPEFWEKMTGRPYRDWSAEKDKTRFEPLEKAFAPKGPEDFFQKTQNRPAQKTGSSPKKTANDAQWAELADLVTKWRLRGQEKDASTTPMNIYDHNERVEDAQQFEKKHGRYPIGEYTVFTEILRAYQEGIQQRKAAKNVPPSLHP